MSSFTTPLILEPLSEKYWKLVEPFDYVNGPIGSSDVIEVPIGTVTDFASIPRIFWSILPPWGKYGKAAVVHDFLYQTQKRSRKESDKIFLDGMKVLKVPKWKREVMYYAVRLFGWIPWKKKKKLLKK